MDLFGAFHQAVTGPDDTREVLGVSYLLGGEPERNSSQQQTAGTEEWGGGAPLIGSPCTSPITPATQVAHRLQLAAVGAPVFDAPCFCHHVLESSLRGGQTNQPATPQTSFVSRPRNSASSRLIPPGIVTSITRCMECAQRSPSTCSISITDKSGRLSSSRATGGPPSCLSSGAPRRLPSTVTT